MNFHNPLWLYAIIAVVIIVGIVFLLAENKRKKDLTKFASIKLLPELSKTYSKAKARLKYVLLALGAIAICIALARPQYGYRWEESKAKGVDVIFAIDTSKSMLAEDITPNRLERTKLAVIDLADMLKGDRVGIVAFSGQAFLQCPLTLDYDAFKMSLEALDTKVIQRGGTNIASAITEAEVAFEKSSGEKILILISDGEELEASAVEKAKQAHEKGIKIFTLGVGSAKGEAITYTDNFGNTIHVKDELGNVVKSRLNEKVLSQIAQVSGGFYGQLSNEAIKKIVVEGINKSPEQELASRMKRLPIERFQIPLIIAIILIALETLVGTRKFFTSRVNILIITLLLFVALPNNNLQAQQANNTSEEKQKTELKSENKQKEQPSTKNQKESAKALYNKGVDAYENNDFQTAQDMFKKAMEVNPYDFQMHAKSIYNIANTHYKAAMKPLLDLEAPLPNELNASIQQCEGQCNMIIAKGKQLLSTGLPLLEKEKQMLANAKNDQEKKNVLKNSPLKNQQFQQQLQQAISECENMQKTPDKIESYLKSSQDAWDMSNTIVQKAKDLYQDASKLNPELENLEESKKIAEQTLEKIKEQNTLLNAAKQQMPELRGRIKSLEKLKEELKKLLRNDNNQNQQNNQNKDQQQNKDNKQNQQNQDQQQNKDNKQNQQNKDKQNKQDKQQNKDNKQDNQQNQDQQQNKDNKDQQNNQNKQQNKDNKQDKQNQQNKDKQNNKSSDDNSNKDEQAVENKPKKNTSDAKEQKNKQNEQKNAELPKQADKQQAQQAKAQQEDAKENYRKAEGVMTKAEAKQLLDSLKEDQKILPLRGFGEQKRRFEEPNYKDW